MTESTCPHCGAMNAPNAAFCESCGKALPLVASTGPRVVTAQSLPTTAAGSQMLGDQLQKHTKRAATTLLVVGILQVLIGGVLFVVLSNIRGANPEAANAAKLTMLVTAILGAIFIGLSFWARKSPLPASIVGLTLYSTLVLINVITNASQLAHAEPGARGSGIGGLGVGWLDIVIIVFLAQGIKAALDRRKLIEGTAGVR